MQTKIDAGVVVVFNPEDTVFTNIISYVDHVKSLYIVDNSTEINTLHTQLLAFNNVFIIHKSGNIGIAKALNLALERAHQDNYQWLMTLDQDTSFNPKDIELFLDAFAKLDKHNVALLSPLHTKKNISIDVNTLFVEKKYVMTSANIVNVRIAKELGGYNEKFFIDEVDHDFCFKVHVKAYKILQHTSISVNHALGEIYKDRLHIKIYPSVRLYYMIRNYLYLKQNYYTQDSSFFKERDKYLLKFFTNQLIYGKNRLKNIQMIVKGMLAYMYNKSGKIDHA